ncbi:hypothetical protein SISSUDRAFT_1036964 [Sistotremastrum suecicum HHB10207 ss-3]|uniref:Uncharacterized protein n=1 Tax=Sistotremastrum suecicum HHB10207 ss-3 TaxID=1314776 RepID=A0A165YSN4_9AGAM|nr:hypothetical protein SISSUDRAFT_1036964 [Sistotremastrum suecicum HHB10207 ss-3]
MQSVQYIQDPPLFWTQPPAVTRVEYAKIKLIQEISEKARRDCVQRHSERVKSRAAPSRIRAGPPKVVKQSPVIVDQFSFLGYRATIFSTGPDLFCVQFMNIKTGKPALESPDKLLPFQAFRTTVYETGTLWIPCWSESSKFETTDMRTVYYTYDAYNQMIFVDRVTRRCLARLGMKHEVQMSPSLDSDSQSSTDSFLES